MWAKEDDWVRTGCTVRGGDICNGDGESLVLCYVGKAPWLQCASQAKCLFMSVGQRWPCSAATWKALDALMRPNYRVCVCLRDCDRARRKECLLPRLHKSCFFFHSVIACFVALQTSATSKYRADGLVTVTACHACFIPCDVELQTAVTCHNVG